jgi:ubiquinone/menaquinone biosynthesis C-methylase UbiE
MDPDHGEIVDLTQGKTFSNEVIRGQATYTEDFLKFKYDLIVHHVVNRFFWRSPTQRLHDLYARHVSAHHLDVGVGSGFFLDKCRFPTDKPHIALMDLSTSALKSARRRIARYENVKMVRCNVLEPIVFDERFDSIGLVYLLHCIPGSLEEKGVALGHLKRLLKPGGVLFGATILEDPAMKLRFHARFLSKQLRRHGVFANERDTHAGLESAMKSHFKDYEIAVQGNVATFVAHANA